MSSFKSNENPPQNASDLYTKYWSYAEHCRPCTHLSGVNWWKQKQITLIVPIGYSLFADHRSVPSSGPGFVCLTIFCLSRVRVHRFRDNAVTGEYWNQWYPLSTWYRMSGTSGIYYYWLPDRLCSSPPLLGFYWNRWGGGETALPQASMPTIYKQHLYNMTPYTLKYGPGLEKPCSPSSVITEHCACASRITRPDSPMRHIDTDRFLHDMVHITYHI